MRHLILFATLVFAASSTQALPVKRTVLPNGKSGYIKVFVQPSENNQSDILFVIDDSGSMDSYQQTLAANIPVLAEAISGYGISTHAAVLSTSVDGFTSVPGVFKANLKNDDRLFSSQLSAAMRLGANGASIEAPFDSVNLALSEPLLSTKNSGFLRENVPLNIIFVTDAEDQSRVSYDQFKSFITGLKSAGQLSLYAFMAPATDTVCQKDSLNPVPKLEKLINELNGQIFKICDVDWRAPMISIGEKMVKEITRTVKLPTEPVLHTVEVRYGSQKLTGGDLRRGWVYDESINSIVIGDEFNFTGQPAGTELEIKFVPKYWQ